MKLSADISLNSIDQFNLFKAYIPCTPLNTIKCTDIHLHIPSSQRRFLNLHEYQALAIFDKGGVAVPKNKVLKDIKDLDKVYDWIGTDCVVKSQVLAGGRGLGEEDYLLSTSLIIK
jgi:hypothetical protein